MLTKWKPIKLKRDWAIAAFPGIAIVVAVVIGRCLGVLESPELTALDTFLRLRPPEPTDPRMLVIGIDEADIQSVGRYPIPDQELATVLKTVQQYQPSAIGLDVIRDLPVEPGHAELAAVLRASRTVIAGEVALADVSGRSVKPPAAIAPEQVGFADVVLEKDGSLRRSLLGSHTDQGQFRYSLAIRLTETYLATHRPGLSLLNGIHNPNAMRIGTTEFPLFQPNTGGYVGADAGGIQTLLNFRRGRKPFRILSLNQIKAKTFDPAWLRDRVVLIGITAPSVKDQTITAAVPIPEVNRGLISGVEIQAHMVSQLLSAVLDDRPMLQTWSDTGEILWIMVWGGVGISLGAFVRSPWRGMMLLSAIVFLLISMSYGLIFLGWWVPIVPPLIILTLNGAGLIARLFYRAEQILERQLVVEELFTEIHNRPLQTLKQLQREIPTQAKPSEQFLMGLQHVDQELRAVYNSAREDLVAGKNQLRLGLDRTLNLQAPLHEILHEVYCDTLERDFLHFKAIKVKIVEFVPLETRRLSLAHKRGLCRFLEEALCNVGKYAIGTTRLTVLCVQEGDRLVIRVTDNGTGLPSDDGRSHNAGFGTQQAKNLARRLRGKFRRYPNEPKGTICEIIWPIKRPWF